MRFIVKLLSVFVGIVSALSIFFPIASVVIGSCLFEEGCGRYESIKLIAAVAIAVIVGVLFTWLSHKFLTKLLELIDPTR